MLWDCGTESLGGLADWLAGWLLQDAKGYRRVVPSPRPLDIVEARAIELLVQAGVITVSCGGGGIPVALDPERGNRRYGVEAVVDKDAASAVLATKLQVLVGPVSAGWLHGCLPAQRRQLRLALPPAEPPQLWQVRLLTGHAAHLCPSLSPSATSG